MQEMFNKDLEELKNKQTEMNNTLEGINSRITGRMDKQPGREIAGNYCCKTKYGKKNEKNEDSLRMFWEYIKVTNICFIGVPEGEERERTQESI